MGSLTRAPHHSSPRSSCGDAAPGLGHRTASFPARPGLGQARRAPEFGYFHKFIHLFCCESSQPKFCPGARSSRTSQTNQRLHKNPRIIPSPARSPVICFCFAMTVNTTGMFPSFLGCSLPTPELFPCGRGSPGAGPARNRGDQSWEGLPGIRGG